MTLAVDDWFDKNLEDLPIALRQRVERKFPSMLWGDLSAPQRRDLSLQLDYQRDSATEQGRQFWWDFFVRRDELQAEIAKWKSAATPTASDISRQESRLKELQQEFDRMELQKRQARGDYYPERKSLDADKVSIPTTPDYIPYRKAMNILSERLKATPEELAVWISPGPDLAGIAAYRNANELKPPPRFYFDCSMGEDYLSPLMACWFRKGDIDQFDPADRYIIGTALIKRWSNQPGLLPEAFIRAKIAESRLLSIHPTFGITRGVFDDDACFPPLSAGLFAISLIEKIEADDGLDPALVLSFSDAEPVQDGAHKKGGRPKGPLAEAVEMAYHRFRNEGNTDILKPGNLRSFLKSFGSLINEDAQSKEFGKGNICDYLAERIKEVKTPRKRECFVTTQDRKEGRRIYLGKKYSQKEIAKLLTNLRDKHPLPT